MHITCIYYFSNNIFSQGEIISTNWESIFECWFLTIAFSLRKYKLNKIFGFQCHLLFHETQKKIKTFLFYQKNCQNAENRYYTVSDIRSNDASTICLEYIWKDYIINKTLVRFDILSLKKNQKVSPEFTPNSHPLYIPHTHKRMCI